MTTTVYWLRRDLRRGDNPALLAAREAADGGEIAALFVIDEALWHRAGAARRAWLAATLRATYETYDRDQHVDDYAQIRDRPDLDLTSRLSPHLKFGTIHPRTMLSDLAGRCSEGVSTYVTELSALTYDDPQDAIDAWRTGTTGYPIVDAGMRQLLAEGWMHNRVRMITGSFLTEDLHVWWPVGARHFLDHLVDGDVASNNHGWQWVAGTGTDAAPYFRVFNPITQGIKFDLHGDYVRRWLPELRHLDDAAVHEPWKHDDGYRAGYPKRIVDHAEERVIALDRYRAARG